MTKDRKARPTEYEIQVSGHLSPERAEWFGDMTLSVRRTTPGGTVTVLTGPVLDRAALFGILNRIRDLGLTLISVNPMMPDRQGAAGGEAGQEEGQ
jgi:hypothetical protein